MFQWEKNKVMLALKQKEMENCALEKEVLYLHDKELHFSWELERWLNQALE